MDRKEIFECASWMADMVISMMVAVPLLFAKVARIVIEGIRR